MKNLLLFLIVMLSLPVVAQSGSQNYAANKPSSIEWQKQDLIQRIHEQLSTTIRTLVGDYAFLIEIDIATKAMDTNLRGAGGTIDNSVKISDITGVDEERDDYFLFSKLGLAAPVALGGDDGSTGRSPAGTNPLEVVQKVDLFGYMESVKVAVTFPKNMPADVLKNATQYLDTLPLSFGKVRAKIHVKTLDFAKPVNSDIAGLRSRLFESLGSLPSVLIPGLCLILAVLLGMRSLRKSGPVTPTAESSASEAAPEVSSPPATKNVAENSSVATPPPPARAESGRVPPTAPKIKENLARFESYFEHHNAKSILLIKRWLASGNEAGISGLRTLAFESNNEKFASYLAVLSPSECGAWRKLLDEVAEPTERVRGAEFLSREVLSDMASQDLLNDPETASMIHAADSEILKRALTVNPEIGALLLNLLEPQRAAALLDEMEPDKRDELVKDASSFDMARIPQMISVLKQALGTAAQKRPANPFLSGAKTVLIHVRYDTEESVYRALASRMEEEEFQSVCLRQFPWRLVARIEMENLAPLIKSYPLKNKVRLLEALGESEFRAPIYEASAPEGTRVRQMMDLEIDSLRKNAAELARCQESAPQLIAEFLEFIREGVRADSSIQKKLRPLIGDWKNELSGEAPSSSVKTTDPAGDSEPGSAPEAA